MTKTILITGGLGYLGGRISRYLAKLGYDIRISTRRKVEMRPDWSKEFQVVNLDAMTDSDPLELCECVNSVIHLAAMNEIDSLADPVRSIGINCAATLRLLQAAERSGVQHFIYFSTAHVYGAPLVGEISETTLPHPTHPYAITHRMAEDFVLAAHGKQKLRTMVFRLSNGMGAPADHMVNRWTLVFNDLCRQAVSQRRLVLKSSGLQQRDFIPLHDICRATEHLLTIKRWPNDIFNLGSGLSLSIYEAARIVASRCHEILGYSPPIERLAPENNEGSTSLYFRVEKFKKTGFRPVSPMDGIREEVDATLTLCHKFFQ